MQTKSYADAADAADADADGIHTKNNMSPTPSEGGHNNPKLDLVNDDVHTKFGRILSIRSQDIERKQTSDVNQGP